MIFSRVEKNNTIVISDAWYHYPMSHQHIGIVNPIVVQIGSYIQIVGSRIPYGGLLLDGVTTCYISSPLQRIFISFRVGKQGLFQGGQVLVSGFWIFRSRNGTLYGIQRIISLVGVFALDMLPFHGMLNIQTTRVFTLETGSLSN